MGATLGASACQRHLALSVLIALAISLSANAQVRDQPRPMPKGTASISGIIASSDSGRPVALAHVMASLVPASDATGPAQFMEPRTATTDASGHFQLSELPAGSYRLSVSATAYLTTYYGQRDPGRPGMGTTIELAEGQRLKIDMRMAHGSAITGRIVNQEGEPAVRVSVRALRVRTGLTGETIVMPAAVADTDDRGVYRIFGLTPGRYYVSVDSARGIGSLTYAPTYYPGVYAQSEARLITVPLSQDVQGIDFNLQIVTAATVSGMVTGNDLSQAFVRLMQVEDRSAKPQMYSGAVRPDGSFSIPNVPPGQYLGIAKAKDGVAWTSLQVSGKDLTNLALPLGPLGVLNAQLIFEGSTPTSAEMAAVKVSLYPQMGLTTAVGSEVMDDAPNADGTFVITGIGAGDRRVDVQAGRKWTLKSVVLNQHDVTDAYFDARAASGGSLRITLTDQAAQISGLVASPGQPVTPDTVVIAFAADPALWRSPRFIRLVAADKNGSYTITGLPPGDYLVAVADRAEIDDQAILEQVRPTATPLTLREGDRKTQDLKLRAGQER